MWFWEEVARPDSVFGPEECCELARLAASWAAEACPIADVKLGSLTLRGSVSTFNVGLDFAIEFQSLARGGAAFGAVHVGWSCLYVRRE